MSTAALGLALSPRGTLHLDDDASIAVSFASAAAARRIATAFADGAGAGILHLGAVEVDTELPPAFAFCRDLGKRFVTELCHLPGVEAQRPDVEVPPPPEGWDEVLAAAPPMRGAEYLSAETLAALWGQAQVALRVELAAFDGTVEAYLHRANVLWNVVGRVHFHLGENKRDPELPFAFVATYTARVSAAARAQHVPLGQALREYAGAQNRQALLSLLAPVERAAAQSPFVKGLVDRGEVYHPLAWTPEQAHGFLREIPLFESAGLVVRVPDWWKGRRPPRPEVRVTVGGAAPSQLGTEALLDFSVALTLDGEPLTAAETKQLLAATSGLAFIRGKWIEANAGKIAQVLKHWRALEKDHAEGGVSFFEGLRLLAGAERGEGVAVGESDDDGWAHVTAGAWLSRVLDGLRGPEALAEADPGPALRADLRPYQKIGVRWLHFLQSLGLGGCLADDMGLGKTVQIIALLLLMRRSKKATSLLVVPASLIGNWRSEIARFAPDLRVLVAHGSEMAAETLARPPERIRDQDLIITTYGTLPRIAWMRERAWDLLIIDEAQAIKNPDAKQTRALKTVRGRARFALTGTPVENRLGDLWSLFDFLCPGLLGAPRDFGALVKRMEQGAPDGYAPLRALVRPYILRRLKTDKRIISDLPDKTEMRALCSLSKKQAVLYQQAVDGLRADLAQATGIERRGIILAYLMRFKQICNHPSQWLGDGGYAAGDSGKFARLGDIADEIALRQEKALVFSQFREMTLPLSRYLAGIFGRPGLVLSGETAVGKRKALVDDFQREDGPPFFVLSLKAGGTGLNLTAASHVIHFDRWWNPAVENQATDRAFRIGQKRNVVVHKFVCRGTIEERIDAMIASKEAMAREVLGGGSEVALTEMSNDELLKLISLDLKTALAEA